MQKLVMGYPYTEEVLDLLKEMFSPLEAEVALAIPNDHLSWEQASHKSLTALKYSSSPRIKISL